MSDKHTMMSEQEELLRFVREAATIFSEDTKLTSYTQYDIKPGCLFALRWGLDNDCVMVFRLDNGFEPIIFDQVI